MNLNILEPETSEEDTLLNEFMMQMKTGSDPYSLEQAASQSAEAPYVKVLPTPGFCIKSKTKADDKIFINICTSENVPRPKDISEKELLELLQSDDPTGFRIPMSVGDPHAEVDKGGKGCTAYDIVVNPEFYTKIHKQEVFRAFLLRLVVEALESKYETEIQPEFVILKNRKSVGDLREQYVRKESKPFIMEMGGGDSTSQPPTKKLIEEISTPETKRQGKEPKFSIVKEPSTGHPEFLVAEIHLPLIKMANSLTLDIGEDRILLETRSGVYFLDIYLPYNLEQHECGAQFDRRAKILSITMPVTPL